MFFLKNFLKRKELITEFAWGEPISHIVSEDELKRAGNNLRNETFKLAETLRAEMKSAAAMRNQLINDLYKHVDYRYGILEKEIRKQEVILHLILEQMGYKVTRIDQRTELKLIEVTKPHDKKKK